MLITLYSDLLLTLFPIPLPISPLVHKLKFTLDYSGLGAGTHATVNATVVTAAAGITAVQNSLSAERGQFIHDTTNNKIYVNVNNDNLITNLDYQIASSTAAADGDVFFSITGGAGNDTITSGGGDDTIVGGGCRQHYRWSGADDFNNVGVAGGAVSADVITDFTVAQTDQLGAWDLSDIAAAGTTLTDLAAATNDIADTDAVQVVSNAGAVGYDLGGAGADKNLLQLTANYSSVADVQTRVVGHSWRLLLPQLLKASSLAGTTVPLIAILASSPTVLSKTW